MFDIAGGELVLSGAIPRVWHKSRVGHLSQNVATFVSGKYKCAVASYAAQCYEAGASVGLGEGAKRRPTSTSRLQKIREYRPM